MKPIEKNYNVPETFWGRVASKAYGSLGCPFELPQNLFRKIYSTIKGLFKTVTSAGRARCEVARNHSTSR